MLEEWTITRDLRDDLVDTRAKLVAAQAREQVAIAERDDATELALRLAGEVSVCRDLIRAMLGKQRGYKVGCKCNGCREVAAALGEK